jgi:REP element-mobilizing transposase RayT
MARPLRIEYEGAIYHVTARGNERGRIFSTKKDYEKFKEYIASAKIKFGLILHAYVLMTNHYHLFEEIIPACCEYFGVTREEIIHSRRSQSREACI